ncbi:MAG: hypothetical protein WC334_03595 [Kiritimatiellales bacterium]|jgi:hypothetical protein
MNQPIIKAGADGLIWVVVGVFWVIAQIAGAAAKKNQPRPPLSDTDEAGAPAGDPLAELLRKMAGGQELRAEPDEEPEQKTFAPLQSRQSGARTSNPWKPGDIEALPDIKPLRRAAPEPPAPVSVPPQIDMRPKMSAFRNSTPSIKMPTMNLSFQGSATSVQQVPNLGKILNPADKNSLRRAMLSHIIFSPPKALEQAAKQ